MPMTFMSGQETLKYTHPTTELITIQDELSNVSDELGNRLDQEIHNRELEDTRVLDIARHDIQLVNNRIEDTRHTLQPIICVLYNIITSGWFMFINRLFPMVKYHLVNNIIVVYPLSKQFNRKEVKSEYKLFKKELSNSNLKLADLDVRFNID